MNQAQRIAVMGSVVAAFAERGIDDGLTVVEKAKLHVKFLEFIESFENEVEAEKELDVDVKKLIRTLYNEIIEYKPPEDECIQREVQMMKDTQGKTANEIVDEELAAIAELEQTEGTSN